MLHHIPRPFGLGIFLCHSPARNSKPGISLYRGCSFLGECDILGLVQRIQIVEETNVEDNKSTNVKKTVKSGITFGSALAMVISYTAWKAVGWAIFHGLLSWVYVIYFLLRY